MPASDLTAEIAKRHGVLLQADDPILMVRTMLEMHEADHRERHDAMVADLRKLLGAAQADGGSHQVGEDDLRRIAQEAATRTLEQVETRSTDEAAHKLLFELPGAIDRTVLPRLYWKWAAIHAGVLALVFAAGVGLMWWFTPAVHCAAQQGGGIFCGYWLKQ